MPIFKLAIEGFDIAASIILYLLSARAVFLMYYSFKNSRHKQTRLGKERPFTSIIVPAYNEELTLRNCVKGLVKQNYQNLEILIVNDGSTDKTAEVAQALELEHPELVRLVNKPNGGKASALNLGIAEAIGDIVVCIDADSIFQPNTTSQLVACFKDKTVDAVTGNVRISNMNNLLTKSQAIEYMIGINLDKRTFQELNCIQVISGCIGAFRKTAVVEVGGYSSDTLIEDMDLTITLVKNGKKVIYNPYAMAYTEAPENMADLYKQRHRWGYGKWQVLAKHKDILFNKKYGNIGLIGIPYFVAGIWINMVTSVVMFGLLLLAIFSHTLYFYLFTLGLFMIPIILIFLYVIHIDKTKKAGWLPLYLLVQMWYYPYFVMYCDIKSWIDFKLGKAAGWNKFKRLGVNSLPK